MDNWHWAVALFVSFGWIADAHIANLLAKFTESVNTLCESIATQQ
jgi:hypothetical protein